MRKVFYKIILIIMLDLILVTNYSSGKYAYNYEFNAMNLAMQETIQIPYSEIIVYYQATSFLIMFKGLDSNVSKIEASLYNKDYPTDVQRKSFRKDSNNMSISFNFREFRNRRNSGTFVYCAKIYDVNDNLIYQVDGEMDCNM